jgi:hypothetical protein
VSHLQTLSEFELADGNHRYGLLGFDNRLYLVWFYRRWQKRVNEVLEWLETGPPPREIPTYSRPCSEPSDFRPWGIQCVQQWPYPPWFGSHPGWRSRNPFEPSIYQKNYHTYRGFPKDHTLLRLPRPRSVRKLDRATTHSVYQRIHRPHYSCGIAVGASSRLAALSVNANGPISSFPTLPKNRDSL